MRELRQRAASLKRFKVRLDRRGYALEPGQPFRIRSLKRGIDNLVVRAGRRRRRQSGCRHHHYCRLVSVAVKPTSLSMGYAMETRVGSAAWVDQADGGFCPSDTAFTLTGGSDLDFVTEGGAALLDEEIVRIDAFDPLTLSGTLARGCVDTVPASHAAGACLWFVEGEAATDPTEYTPGTTVQARLLPQTSQGQLDPVLASVDSLTMAQRQGRPYPPGLLRINGSAYPASVSGDVVVTWAHRERLLQADQLVDTSQGSIGPEAGTTYSARLLCADTQTVLASQTGIAGTMATLSTTYVGSVIVELWAVRDGLDNWQRWRYQLGHL